MQSVIGHGRQRNMNGCSNNSVVIKRKGSMGRLVSVAERIKQLVYEDEDDIAVVLGYSDDSDDDEFEEDDENWDGDDDDDDPNISFDGDYDDIGGYAS